MRGNDTTSEKKHTKCFSRTAWSGTGSCDGPSAPAPQPDACWEPPTATCSTKGTRSLQQSGQRRAPSCSHPVHTRVTGPYERGPGCTRGAGAAGRALSGGTARRPLGGSSGRARGTAHALPGNGRSAVSSPRTRHSQRATSSSARQEAAASQLAHHRACAPLRGGTDCRSRGRSADPTYARAALGVTAHAPSASCCSACQPAAAAARKPARRWRETNCGAGGTAAGDGPRGPACTGSTWPSGAGGLPLPARPGAAGTPQSWALPSPPPHGPDRHHRP